jgi:hypothetical protein
MRLEIAQRDAVFVTDAKKRQAFAAGRHINHRQFLIDVNFVPLIFCSASA